MSKPWQAVSRVCRAERQMLLLMQIHASCFAGDRDVNRIFSSHVRVLWPLILFGWSVLLSCEWDPYVIQCRNVYWNPEQHAS